MNARARTLLVTLAATAALVALSPACSKQAEGQLCSTKNGQDDCAEGLSCKPLSSVPDAGTTEVVDSSYGVCCPESGATDPGCIYGGLNVGGASTTGTTTSTSSADGGT